MRPYALLFIAAFTLAPLAAGASPTTAVVTPTTRSPLPATAAGKLVFSSNPGNTIEVSSFQWGVGRGISSSAGGSADRESSAPSVSEITIKMVTDKASAELLTKMSAGGQRSPSATLTTAGHTIVMSNVMVSSIHLASMSSGGDRPTESITLNFTKIEFKNSGY
jgi:type VI secretion system secreted protein Hcp